MKNIGFVITSLSLFTIVFYDFKFNRAPNLSLVALVVGMGIFMPSSSWSISAIQMFAVGLVLIILNYILRINNKAKIEAGDCKLILILSFFFKLEIFLGILLISSIFGLILLHSKKKIPFAGILSGITLLLIINFL